MKPTSVRTALIAAGVLLIALIVCGALLATRPT